MHNPLARHRFTPIRQEDLQRVISEFDIRSEFDILSFKQDYTTSDTSYYIIAHRHRDSIADEFARVDDNSHPLHILDDERWQTMQAAKDAIQTITGDNVTAHSTQIAYIADTPYGQVDIFRTSPHLIPEVAASAPWAWRASEKQPGILAPLAVGEWDCPTRTAALVKLNAYLQRESLPWWRKVADHYKPNHSAG